MRPTRFIQLIVTAALCALAVLFLTHKPVLHRPINPDDVVGVRAFGATAAAGPIDSSKLVAWFNQGTDPRQSRDNTGHTTTTGALILDLKSGKQVGLWPEGDDFLVSQGDYYYYLRQPDLKVLLAKLDGR